MKNKSVPVLHPPLFAIFPVIFLYAKNANEIYFHHIVIPLTILLGSTLVIWFVLNIFFKSWLKSGMVISCIVLFMFSYGHIVSKLISTFRLDIDTHTPSLALIWFVLLEVALFGIFKIKTSIIQWTKILNIAALCLVLLNGVDILSLRFQTKNSPPNETVLTIKDSHTITAKISNPPNIFYLIFDGHIGSSGLRQLGHNNSWFVDALEERGFFVAKESHSNYMQTPISLASSLNYAYLDDLSEKLHQTGPHLTDLKKLYPLLDSNRVFRFLKNQGYQIIYCPTDTIFFVHNLASADLVINENNGIWSGVSIELYRNTPFFKNRWVLTHLHRNRILNGLENIKKMKERPRPFILFAHILSPHFPAVFDKDGNYLSNIDQKKSLSSFSAKIEKYMPQMEFIDKQILEIIDFLQDDENPPIIIIQGDHGIRDLIENKDQVTESGSAQIAFSILNAYYMPGYNTPQLHDSISPVNSFPIVFNHYFGTNIEILPDRSFFCSKKSLYDFQDVTSFLKYSPQNVSED